MNKDSLLAYSPWYDGLNVHVLCRQWRWTIRQTDNLLCFVRTLCRRWIWRTRPEWQLAMLCVYAMHAQNVNTVCSRCACLGHWRWTRRQNEHLLSCVCTLWRHLRWTLAMLCVCTPWIFWGWRTRPEWTLAMLCMYAIQALKMNTCDAVCSRCACLGH